MSACNKPDKITLENEGTFIYMATAVDEKRSLRFSWLTQPKTIVIWRRFTAGLAIPATTYRFLYSSERPDQRSSTKRMRQNIFLTRERLHYTRSYIGY